MCWCISKPTSSENTFKEIFYCVKYLRAILLITYLSFYGYDCTNSTWTNMNEWIHEETRVMCYIPHQKWSEVLQFFYFMEGFFFRTVYFRRISVVPEICSAGWNINHSASLWKRNSQLFSQRLDLISVSTICGVFWLAEFVCKTSAFIKIHWLLTQSLWWRLLYSSQLSMPGYKIVHTVYLSTKCEALTL